MCVRVGYVAAPLEHKHEYVKVCVYECVCGGVSVCMSAFVCIWTVVRA
jgi:hypothetical protein